ncbi:hypothetical protein PRIPAC_81420 [Pristionchus pacificus]|nr:hypothetical protein PRIPAC_81420 [Pristionchus pacificus]
MVPSIKAAPAVYEHLEQLVGPPPAVDNSAVKNCPLYPPEGGRGSRKARGGGRASRQAWAMYKADTTVSASSVPPPDAQTYRRPGEVELHETVRLCDVEAFRKTTAETARTGAKTNGLSAGSSHLPSSIRPVIYRYIDVNKCSFALLEAIHFELFMPDRPDLRFLAVPITAVPAGTIEGDYFRIAHADLLSNPLFAVKLGKTENPVVWEAKQIGKIGIPSQNDEDGLAYIVKKQSGAGVEAAAISSVADSDIPIRRHLLPDEQSAREHALVRLAMRSMHPANLYMLEPLHPPAAAPPAPKAADIIRTIESLTPGERAAVYKEYTCATAGDDETALRILKIHAENPQMVEALEAVGVMGAGGGDGKGGAEGRFDARAAYLERVDGVRSSSQREGRVASAVRALDATEAARIRDRLGAFASYGQPGDLQLMHELFRLGSRYREFASQGMDTNDAGEMRIDESIVLRTIADQKLGCLEHCRPLLNCLYGRSGALGGPISAATDNEEQVSVPFVNGAWLELNAAQSRAVRAYADADGPRVFCVRSPPGSGKTTVAAAMAAEVARHTVGESRLIPSGYGRVMDCADYSSVQLLLAVQNVAVDNMGAALKKMEYGGGTVYNMKSAKKLNPREPAPYDYFDLMNKAELYNWTTNKMKLPPQQLRNFQSKMKEENREAQKWREIEECITYYRKEYEKTVYPKIILSTVEMMLQKMYTDSKLISDLAKVRNVIIDEASLLTEAALFAIIRRFPEARIVLIGDDKQLPPFMYDKGVLGHELAGRPALSVAMKTGAVPVIELNEVYRAPPSLAEPYNRLAYGGRLVSRKPDNATPLSDLDLVRRGQPQLLLIDVDGWEERNDRSMSLSNTKELNAVVRLLEKFRESQIPDIMIICLYKDQKWRLQKMLSSRASLKKCTVLTVDSAQGKEAPIVVLLTTRTQRATDFFCSPERCNVAVSRQQSALVILGKAELLRSVHPWSTMTEDYFNGLDIVPLDADFSILSSTTISDEHPWRGLYQHREPPPDHSTKLPSIRGAPLAYRHDHQLVADCVRPKKVAISKFGAALRRPVQSDTSSEEEPETEEWHETIRLCDVEALRTKTAHKALSHSNPFDGLSAGIARLSTSPFSIRPVIYRYIDVMKNSFALLEAIHFELFMPDRPDLRFLAVSFTAVPAGTVEGDYFHLSDAFLLSEPSFAIKLGTVEYPIVWEVKRASKIEFASQSDKQGLAYIVKKKAKGGGETAISEISDGELFIRDRLFPDEESRGEHALVAVTMRKMVTARLYPVEPPLPGPPPPPPPTEEELLARLLALAPEEPSSPEKPDYLSMVYEEFVIGRPPPGFNIIAFLEKYLADAKFLKTLEAVESHKVAQDARDDEAVKTFQAAFGRSNTEVKKAKPKHDPRSEYLKRIDGVQSSSQRSGDVVSALRTLSAPEAERIEDRLGGFTTYGRAGDVELMDTLFKLGSRYRVFACYGADADDAGETKIDESVVLKTILDRELGSLENCRSLLDCIYDRRGALDSTISATATVGLKHLIMCDGKELQLNRAQSRAVRLYADADGPRVFCILSPPGSGKTTVAAAMAAEVARSIVAERLEKRFGYRGERVEVFDHYDTVQLLLSVQNVAVDNMGAALKKMDYGRGTVYNMKSTKKLNPRNPAPYDYFDLMSAEDLDNWKNNKVQLSPEMLRNLRMKREKEKETQRDKKKLKEWEELVTYYRREYEKTVYPKIILSTVEMMLQKMYTDSKLNTDLENVRNVIIDEASLLTEAALFAIIRRFSEARIVLIGDDHQLPPFMYDEKVLGHELAGRPALSVAMKTGKVPVVELNEVYRAPPTLVAPYNRLAYGGRLVSKKEETDQPLSVIGLVHAGCPQLLLIDVDGREERNENTMSLSNVEELRALLQLLQKFPRGWSRDIMIICLYKDQKKRLEEMLDRECKFGANLDKQYTVLTVDSAQGKEAPIVILMTTRTQRASDFFCSTESISKATDFFCSTEKGMVTGQVKIMN